MGQITSTEQTTQSLLGTRLQKALIVVPLIAGTLGIGLSFIFGYTGLIQKPSQVHEEGTIIVKRPLTPQQVYGARLNLNVPGWVGNNLYMSREDIRMAGLEPSTNSFISGDNVWTGRSPLALSLTNTQEAAQTFPARLISLDTFVNGDSQTYTLCLPESEVPGWPGGDTIPTTLSYFYDTNGTPYTDSFLTQRVTSAACDQLLTNALTPQQIYGARLNLNVPTWQNSDGISFIREGMLMGWLNVTTNAFQSGDSVWTGRSPLAVGLINTTPYSKTFPARLISLDTFINGDSQTYTLCLPESELAGWTDGDTSPSKVSYFYDTDGTPYTDSFLTIRSTSESCDQLLANALTPQQVYGARLNWNLPDLEDSISFIREDMLMGRLDPQTNAFQSGDSVWTGRSPLTVGLVNTTQESKILPARLISLDTFVNGDSQAYTLCLPETELAGWTDGDSAPTEISYFYDTNGTPYTDSLLTQRATSAACDQLLTNALTPQEVTTARLNNTVPEWEELLVFMREGTMMSQLNPSTNSFNSGDSVWTGRSPLMLEISNAAIESRTFPARLISLDAFVNGDSASYTLCVPQTEVPGAYDNGDDAEVSYFYDTNGTPYTDSLLTQRVTSGVCKGVEAEAETINNRPVVSITSHTDGQTVTNPNITLAGTATDSDDNIIGLTVSLNYGTPQTISITPGQNINWTHPLVLSSGANAVQVRATDAASNMVASQITIIYSNQ